MDINAYVQIDGDGKHLYYCEDDALALLFQGDSEQLERVKDGTDITFQDIHGKPFSLLHEGTVQYESFQGEIIPLEGVFCMLCGAELYPSFEEMEAI